MAAGWVKSLQCKSRAYDDVVDVKKLLPLPPPMSGRSSASCRNSFQGLKDVIPNPNRKSSKTKFKPESESDPDPAPRKQHHHQHQCQQFLVSISDPYLSELQEGHPSRNVVEIIFNTRWGGHDPSSPKGFSGRIEMVFKLHNLPKTVARFDEYREAVKTRAAAALPGPSSSSKQQVTTTMNINDESVVRCAADGNEMMRFRCLGPTSSVIHGICGAAKGYPPDIICTTFDGSGAAHDSSGGGSRGRKAMLLCRVIAGRVAKGKDHGLAMGMGMGMGMGPVPMFESVAGDNGELLVFDSRAVLPCFLVIYRL